MAFTNNTITVHEITLEREPCALALVAISGDCAAGGMGEANEILPIDITQKRIVKKFLEAALAFDIACKFTKQPMHVTPLTIRKNDALNEAGEALRDAGIFQHKWHKRTSWELVYIDELEPRHEPFVVMPTYSSRQGTD